MFKKSMGLALCVIMMIAVVSGCGSNSGSTKESNAIKEEASTNEPNASAASNPKADEEQVTISFVNWNNKGEEKPLLEAFMAKYPNIKVEHSIIQGDQYGKLLKTRVLSGDIPDVFIVAAPEYPSFAREGYLLDVTDEPGTKAAFPKSGTDVFQKINGKLYGAAVWGNANLHPIYYNKKIFAKLNLEAPKNLEEFYAICEKLKVAGVDPVILGAKDGWTTGLFSYIANPSEINSKYQPGLTEKVLNKEVSIKDVYGKSFDMMESMSKKGYFSKASLSLTYDQSVQYFLDGKAAILPNGAWFVQDKNLLAAKDFELGVFFPPLDQVNGKYILSADNSGGTVAVSAKSKHVEAAKKLYNFIFEKENHVVFLNNLGYTSLIPNLGLKVDPLLKDYFDQVYNSPDKVDYFLLGQKDSLISTLGTSESKSDQNILAGSTAEKELKQMEIDFEKIKPTLKFDSQ